MFNGMWLIFWALHGRMIGAVLIVLPIIWDILWWGARSKQAWQIESWGVVCIIIGLVCVVSSWVADRQLR